MTDNEGDSSIPVTCFTGFLGAVSLPYLQDQLLEAEPPNQGKTTTILGLLKQLPKDYKVPTIPTPAPTRLKPSLVQVVLLKNEYGDVEGQLAASI